jgi:hypothetical protein
MTPQSRYVTVLDRQSDCGHTPSPNVPDQIDLIERFLAGQALKRTRGVCQAAAATGDCNTAPCGRR